MRRISRFDPSIFSNVSKRLHSIAAKLKYPCNFPAISSEWNFSLPSPNLSQDVSDFVRLSLLRLTELINIDALSSRLNLPYWSGEPFSSPEKPATESPCANDTHSYGSVVESLICHWIYCREAEGNGDKANPQNSHNPDGLGEDSKGEWPTLKIAGIYQSDQNRETIRNI